MAAATTTKTTRHCPPQRNDAGSIGAGGYFRLWNSFSVAAFRRRIIDSIRCGGGSIAGCSTDGHLDNIPPRPKPKPKPQKPPLLRPARADSETGGSEKLSDFLNLSSSSDSSSSLVGAAPGGLTRESVGGGGKIEKDAILRRKVEKFDELSKAVKLLQREGFDEEKGNGAKLVRLLAKEDSEARSTLAMLGAIPPLVGMLDVDDDGGGDMGDELRIEALYALLNLGVGNDLNRAAVVQAGAVHKMLKMIDSSNGSRDSSVLEAIVANFLALSALDSNKPIIGSSGAIPFLVKTLKDIDKKHSSQAKQDALRALYNFSILPSNLPLILETDLVQYFICSLGDMEVSEVMLSTLSNLVSTPEGRKAISSVADSLPILIDVLNWVDSPGCQEKASYILMVMAHKAYNDRQAMVEAGISSALLELTLIGSTLAQNRASRILECLRMDKGKQILDGNDSTLTLSAPIYGDGGSGNKPSSSLLPRDLGKDLKDGTVDLAMSEESKAVKQLVQQSLLNNMRKIARRANLPQDFVPSEHLKSLTSSSTSKSLPY